MLRFARLSRMFCTAVASKKPQYKFKFASSLIPHPQKVDKGGEDALFASQNVLFVADGVGGWSGTGIDPGLYSKKLASLVKELTQKEQMRYIEDPKQLMKDIAEMNKLRGSSTATLLTLHPVTGMMRGYYLGDSVYAFANSKVHGHRVMEIQEHQFNCPYSIGDMYGDDPREGIYKEHSIEELSQGEVVIVASDGIWDSLKWPMIHRILEEEGQSLQEKANFMAETANHYGKLKDYNSPFSMRGPSRGNEGKLDDVTVILANVVKE